MKHALLTAALAIVFSTGGTNSAAAQNTTETFLLVPRIPGESTAAGHQDWIDVHSFSQHLDGSKKDQGACTVFVVKAIDRASLPLLAAVVGGDVFDEIRLESFRVGSDDRGPFYALTLSDAYIAGTTLTELNEIVTITAARATLRYFRPDGSRGGQEETKVTVHCK